jgi:hypothetical protein
MLENAGWSFAGVQIFEEQNEDGLLMLGEVINNTGTTQELYYISGTFYDAQGAVIADENDTDDYWPFEIIPPGGRMPFGMFVDGIENAANFELSVTADPSEEILEQDLEFINTTSSQPDTEYCVTGQIQNLGNPLQYILITVAVLYDSRGNIVNFADFSETTPANVTGTHTPDFKLCADDFDREIAHYELRAWGQ